MMPMLRHRCAAQGEIFYLIQTLGAGPCTDSDPGIVLPGDFDEAMEAGLSGTRLVACDVCSMLRPPRARHCHRCGFCIMDLDHHCQWVGKCIGKKNYTSFKVFTITLSLYFWFIFLSTGNWALPLAMARSDEMVGDLLRAMFGR